MIVEKDLAVYERCLRSEPSFIAEWETLVNMDSPTGYSEGLAQVRGWIVERLNRLGARVWFILPRQALTKPMWPGSGMEPARAAFCF